MSEIMEKIMKTADQIVMDWLRENSPNGNIPKAFHSTRNPDFTGIEEELADHIIHVLKTEFAKTPEQIQKENLTNVYEGLGKILEYANIWQERQSSPELLDKLRKIWFEADWLRSLLGQYVR